MTAKEFRYENVYYFSGLPKGFGIAAIVQFFIFLAIQAGVKNDGSSSDQIQIGIANFAKICLFILIGVTALFIVLNIFKFIKGNAKYRSYLREEKRDYEEDKRKYDIYEEQYTSYLAEMSKYNECVEAYTKEEAEIAHLLKNDLEKIRNKITETELNPALKKLEEESDNFINPNYYSDLSIIIDFIEKYRADTLKEALNLLEEKKYQDKQLALKEEQMERERIAREEELERLEDERLQRERERREDLAREERQRREQREREERAERQRRAEESKNRRDALAQCSRCAAIHGCPNYGKYPNCPNFRSR